MSRKDLDISETRTGVAILAGYLCKTCHKSLPADVGELAHKIPNRDHLVKKYSAGVIHHIMNFEWTCAGDCNDAVSIGGDPVAQTELANRIRVRILEDVAIRIHVSPHLYTSLIDRLAKVARGEP